MIFPELLLEEQVEITKAFLDIIWLLDKGYPKKSSITFVGNHYRLSKNARYFLNRITHSTNDLKKVKSKIVQESTLVEGSIFHIDLYNQLTSFQSLIDGELLIVCRDGIYRDIFSMIHSKTDLRLDNDSIKHYINHIRNLKPSYIRIYIDQQRSNSQKHANIVREVLKQLSIDGECIISKSVDYLLKNQAEGVIFSHDSVVVKQSVRSFDYIKWYIEKSGLGKGAFSQIMDISENINGMKFR